MRNEEDHAQQAGQAIEFVWDGRDDSGAPVASGVYLYRLETNSFRQTRKMVLMK